MRGLVVVTGFSYWCHVQVVAFKVICILSAVYAPITIQCRMENITEQHNYIVITIITAVSGCMGVCGYW